MWRGWNEIPFLAGYFELASALEEELYYPSSENKDADQLRGYREADLRLCFRLCRLLVFPLGGSYHLSAPANDDQLHEGSRIQLLRCKAAHKMVSPVGNWGT